MNVTDGSLLKQYSAKFLERWGQMTHHIGKYWDIDNVSGWGQFYHIAIVDLKFVGT